MPEPATLETKNVSELGTIKWCDGHWSELIFALKDRGLGDAIAPDEETLTHKFLKGETDVCWEAAQRINMGAMEIFGPVKVISENGGCPVCAFANIVQHAADLTAINHNKVQ